MVNEKILFVGVLVIILLSVIPLVIAVDDLISLQGNVKQSGANLASGNITVTIYDAFTGGNMVYNSTTDFNSAISSGEYDLVLGNSSNTLSLNYGQYYYMEIYVNNEKITYQDGATRQIFQSSVGNISVEDIDFSSKIVLTNQSSTFDAGKNLTMGVGGWFKGMFDWFIKSDSTQYLTFNGTTLSLNEVNLNSTIDSRLSTANLNVTANYINVTYINVTEIRGGRLYFTFINVTYLNVTTIFADFVNVSSLNVTNLYVDGQAINGTFLYNHTLHTFNNYNSTWDNRALIQNLNLTITDNNLSWLSTYNSSYHGLIQNLSYLSTYNESYAQWAYNQTLAGDTRFVNIDGDTMTGMLSISSGGLNVSGGDSIFGGGWTQGGVTITGGNIFAQTIFVYNITSLGVSTLNINGSLMPQTGFTNTFDVGNSSLNWRNGYFGTEIYINGVAVSSSITNNNLSWLSTFNSTYEAWNYNQTTGTFNLYNSTWDNRLLIIQSNASMKNYVDAQILTVTSNNSWNQSWTDNLYIATGNLTIYNGLIQNLSYLSTYNSTYDSKLGSVWSSNATAMWNLSALYVGIGTANPRFLLDVNGTINATSFRGDGLFLTNVPTYNLSYHGLIQNLSYLSTYNSTYDSKLGSVWSSNATAMWNSTVKQVGIGTTTPRFDLDVNGTINATNGMFRELNLTGQSLFGTPVLNLMGVGSYTGNLLTLNHSGYGGNLWGIRIQGGVGVPTGSLEIGEGFFDYFVIQNGTGNIGIGVNNPLNKLQVDGSVLFTGSLNLSSGDLDVAGGDITTASLNFGTATTAGTFEFEDSSVCIGVDGCTAATATQGRLFVEDSINVGDTTPDNVAYNKFGSGTKGRADINASDDVYISGYVEVDGVAYLAGGTVWTQGDIAENIATRATRDNKICNNDVSCFKETTTDDLDYGDLVCIDPTGSKLIMKCNGANSRLAVGFISSTAVLNVEPGIVNGYPISLAGIVNARVTNENGNVMPGDLLVSSSKPGYAMKNDNPRDGTVVGKAFDFCDKEECKIPVFVALS